jgi:hypothetical protein
MADNINEEKRVGMAFEMENVMQSKINVRGFDSDFDKVVTEHTKEEELSDCSPVENLDLQKRRNSIQSEPEMVRNIDRTVTDDGRQSALNEDLNADPKVGSFKTSVNMFKSLVGLGILAFPGAMRKIGVTGGCLGIIIAALINWYTI